MLKTVGESNPSPGMEGCSRRPAVRLRSLPRWPRSVRRRVQSRKSRQNSGPGIKKMLTYVLQPYVPSVPVHGVDLLFWDDWRGLLSLGQSSE